MWDGDRTYLAGSGRILQAGDTAVLLGGSGINVLRRGEDGSWRYAIALLSAHAQRR